MSGLCRCPYFQVSTLIGFTVYTNLNCFNTQPVLANLTASLYPQISKKNSETPYSTKHFEKVFGVFAVVP